MVGNWKMNKTVKDCADFFEAFKADIESGDPVVIQLAIKNAVKVSGTVIPEIPSIKNAYKDLQKTKELLGDIDFQQFIDENNKIDRKGLENYIKQRLASGENVNGAACLDGQAVVIIYTYTLGIVLDGIVINPIYPALSAVIYYDLGADNCLQDATVIATDQSTSFSDGGGDSDGDSNGGGGEKRLANSSLKEELLAAGIAERF